MRELIARVKVILRRKSNIQDTNVLQYSDLKLDLGTEKMHRRESNIL